MIGFAHPEAFLLAAPLVWLVWRRVSGGRPAVTALRLTLVVLAAALVAGPVMEGGTVGRDLVLLIDRSRSVGAEHTDQVAEVAGQVARALRTGDRAGAVVFGRDARVEAAPAEGFTWHPPRQRPEADGTDLGAAIRSGLALIPSGRPGSLLLLSDGEDNVAGAEAAALAAAERGVRVDVVPLRRPGAVDLHVSRVAPPPEVDAGEPFLVPAWIHSDTARVATVRVVRDGAVIAEGQRPLAPGANRILARDRLDAPGIHRYRVEVLGVEDRVPENNAAGAVVRARGRPRVLCVTPRGRVDRLTRSLALSGIEVVTARADAAPLDLDALDGFRAVVLENVPAGDLRRGGMLALRRWVTELGGGLLMTGGRASFGVGGYRRSPVEDALPVSMEVRKEQRRFSVAMALALDRSGSMAMTVGGGVTKMELANRGAAEAVRLLGPGDSVAVLAIDSSPHLVVPLTDSADREPIIRKVMGIDSMGGGIYTSTAIHAAAAELEKAPQAAKHIVLFADASDAEEPGDLATFVPELVRAGVTLSVIALGSASDPDAAFLTDTAKRGGGRCTFVEDPADLPRVFAEETIQTLKASIVEEPVDVEPLAPLTALGDLERAFPRIGGYSIAYARPGAQVAGRSVDDIRAPILSYWQKGLGRSAALLAEADGALSGGLASWDGYGDLVTTLVRWLGAAALPDELFASVVRTGREATVIVEAERGAEGLLAEVQAQVLGPDGTPTPLELVRTGPDRLEGRFVLAEDGVYRPVVRVGESVGMRLAPVTLPMSPELEPPTDPRAGERLLERIARLTGGSVDPPAAELTAGPREGTGTVDLAPWVAALALLLLLAEIAVRRLGLGLGGERISAALRSLGTSVARIPGRMGAHLRRAPRGKATPGGPDPARAGAADREDAPASSQERVASAPAPPPGPPSPSDITDVLSRARDRARKRR
jgi:uncharacterized membrane protein